MEENKDFSEINEPVEQHSDIEPQEQEKKSEAAPSFDFGEKTVMKRQGGHGMFFAVFGGVVAVCVLLLIGTLFLGEEGIRIIKTLYNERTIYVREDDGSSGLLTPNEAADTVRSSTVTVSVKTKSGSTGIGSGFVYDDKGHICTNYHVIEDFETIQVILPDGTARDAVVKGYDVIADLAVLTVDAAGLVPAKLGVSAELLVGDAVVAVGTPSSLDLAGTATFGNVSATNRLLALTDSEGTVYRKISVIQTDASVNPGNSGGPMADMYGQVVGIVVRKMVSNYSTAYEGLGFAIPIDGARVILDAIIKNDSGMFEGDNPLAEGRSLLGVTGHGGEAGNWYTVDPESGIVLSSPSALEGYHYMSVDGVYVSEISGNNVRGKLQVGDIITAVNGLRVTTIQDIIGEVNRHWAGEQVSVTLLREGETHTVTVTLMEGTVS